MGKSWIKSFWRDRKGTFHKFVGEHIDWLMDNRPLLSPSLQTVVSTYDWREGDAFTPMREVMKQGWVRGNILHDDLHLELSRKPTKQQLVDLVWDVLQEYSLTKFDIVVVDWGTDEDTERHKFTDLMSESILDESALPSWQQLLARKLRGLHD